jgi:hypothetical protein
VIVTRIAGFDHTFARIEIHALTEARGDAIDLARAVEIAIRKAAAYRIRNRKRHKGRGR